MTSTRFAIVGGGWRAEFYLRVAAAIPERFGVSGVLARDATKRAALGSAFSVATPSTLDDLLAAGPTSSSSQRPGRSRRTSFGS